MTLGRVRQEAQGLSIRLPAQGAFPVARGLYEWDCGWIAEPSKGNGGGASCSNLRRFKHRRQRGVGTSAAKIANRDESPLSCCAILVRADRFEKSIHRRGVAQRA
jgi:hypothetical protein